MNVLISLYKGYGLGDAVQMSAVLRHLVKYRPHWRIDYQAEEGRHQVGRGIIANTFAYGRTSPAQHYDAEKQICLYDTWANWHDRPNTRVSSCLHEVFDLAWDAECGRYQVQVDEASKVAVAAMLRGVVVEERMLLGDRRVTDTPRNGNRYVAFHYEGDSSQEKKNLTHEQADKVCRAILETGCLPLILDWRQRCPLPYRKLTTPRDWGRDAEMVCAVIQQCEAFIGIDSGPSKCASATDTPSLVTWTGHHPAPFHDPAPNTTHLVPVGYHGLEPVCNDAGVIKWFEAHHSVRQYESCPTVEISKWLKEVIK